MIRQAVLLFLLFCAPFFPAQAAKAQDSRTESRFLTALNDVPLMPGLYELMNEAVVFDKPGGRIAESAARSERLHRESIERFYSATLPQLGWSLQAPGTYIREGEELRIVVAEEPDARVVTYSLRPR
jgi:hypothetical protein